MNDDDELNLSLAPSQTTSGTQAQSPPKRDPFALDKYKA